VTAIASLRSTAQIENWSPRRLRRELRTARTTCRRVWLKAIVEVFGVSILDLPDFRQLDLFP
jgi:hypothetical protein